MWVPYRSAETVIKACESKMLLSEDTKNWDLLTAFSDSEFLIVHLLQHLGVGVSWEKQSYMRYKYEAMNQNVHVLSASWDDVLARKKL